MRRFIAVAAVAIVAAVVIVIAVSGGGSKQTASATGRSPSSVSLHKSSLGSILVDSRGRTLYLFEADKAGMSACSGSCAALWPPLMANGTLHGGAGVQAAKLGTIARSEGGRQVTYNGHPLYTFAGDAKAGDTKGQGLDQFGAEWYVLNAAGNKIDED